MTKKSKARLAKAAEPVAVPTQAERVFASANTLLTHFSPDAANIQLQVQSSPDVTFLRLAEYLRCYASCLLAAAQAEQDRKE
jgi:uncharacterized protein YfaS (alpha-2-macroglobulin family)